jgi:plasmid stability protein
MANLQVKDIDERLYAALRRLASDERRSISQEVAHILEKYLSSKARFDRNPTEAFLALSGAWVDERETEDIVQDIRKSRNSNQRLKADNGLFD